MSMAWTAKWLTFSKIGQVIDGLFLPLKVPLRSSLNKNLKSEDRFSWDDVFRKHSNIGLVIDLTKTAKYYAPESIANQRLEYRKIWMEGHGSIPPASQVREFCDMVDAFLAKDSSRGRIIAVHCTHGLNRTGYMICKYLILRRNIPPPRAMQMFESCRGERMERPAYVTDLRSTSTHDAAAENRRLTDFWQLGPPPHRPQSVHYVREQENRSRHTSADVRASASLRSPRIASSGSSTRATRWSPRPDLRTRLVDQRTHRHQSSDHSRPDSRHRHSSATIDQGSRVRGTSERSRNKRR